MALGINTNVASLSAQNQLSNSQKMNDQALERLSSGLRINSAKDDAAGLAISTRFQSQITGLNVAQRNANDGISLAQTAEGALDEVTNNLQRIRELAVQSANSTNSASDRAALDQEVQQRISEIDRIAQQTAFNGLNVLDGSLGQQNFQVGANAGETISMNLTQGARENQIGSFASDELSVTGTALTGDLTIKVGSGEAQTVNATTDGSAKSIAEAIKASGVDGLSTVSAENEQELAFGTVSASSGGGEYLLQVNGQTVLQRSTNSDNSFGDVTAEEVASAINDSDIEGISAEVDGSNIVIREAEGADFSLTETVGGSASTDGFNLNATTATDYNGTVTLESNENITIGGTNDAAQLGVTDGDQISVDQSTTLADVSIKDVDGANDAIKRVDAALNTVNGLRSELGALQNRFESTIANLATSSENLSASNSRILDADFAAETAKLSKSQVLQQAGISVLAQANARPQQVLSLLQ